MTTAKPKKQRCEAPLSDEFLRSGDHKDRVNDTCRYEAIAIVEDKTSHMYGKCLCKRHMGLMLYEMAKWHKKIKMI